MLRVFMSEYLNLQPQDFQSRSNPIQRSESELVSMPIHSDDACLTRSLVICLKLVDEMKIACTPYYLHDIFRRTHRDNGIVM